MFRKITTLAIAASIIFITGCSMKNNETEQALVESIISCTTENDFIDNCAVNVELFSETIPVDPNDPISTSKYDPGYPDDEKITKHNVREWKKTKRELDKYEIDSDAVVTNCMSQESGKGTTIAGYIKQGETTYGFRLEECYETESGGWRTSDDLNIKNL